MSVDSMKLILDTTAKAQEELRRASYALKKWPLPIGKSVAEMARCGMLPLGSFVKTIGDKKYFVVGGLSVDGNPERVRVFQLSIHVPRQGEKQKLDPAQLYPHSRCVSPCLPTVKYSEEVLHFDGRQYPAPSGWQVMVSFDKTTIEDAGMLEKMHLSDFVGQHRLTQAAVELLLDKSKQLQQTAAPKQSSTTTTSEIAPAPNVQEDLQSATNSIQDVERCKSTPPISDASYATCEENIKPSINHIEPCPTPDSHALPLGGLNVIGAQPESSLTSDQQTSTKTSTEKSLFEATASTIDRGVKLADPMPGIRRGSILRCWIPRPWDHREICKRIHDMVVVVVDMAIKDHVDYVRVCLVKKESDADWRDLIPSRCFLLQSVDATESVALRFVHGPRPERMVQPQNIFVDITKSFVVAKGDLHPVPGREARRVLSGSAYLMTKKVKEAGKFWKDILKTERMLIAG